MLTISTPNPQGLLDAIYAAIDQTDKKGKIETWIYNENRSFTHDTADKEWLNEAFMRPLVPVNKPNTLIFNIIRPKGYKISVRVYAIYHGRFAEMLLAHFDKDFSSCLISAMPEGADLV